MENNTNRTYLKKKKSWESDLFIRLDALMKEEQLYLDSKLTRKELAIRLGTNECYLVASIHKACDGQTFSEYINSHRLDYAYKRLQEERMYSVEKISLESGFASRTTFYRLFKKRFGTTPTKIPE